ncbi:hypothetical protein ZWY2020_051547 [Hordeum vulgare]|nr:hypothetical protein ZWY2020_051547 [Hordeum vulgare]
MKRPNPQLDQMTRRDCSVLRPNLQWIRSQLELFDFPFLDFNLLLGSMQARENKLVNFLEHAKGQTIVDGEHDNVNQLQIQQNSSSPQNLVIEYVPMVREIRDHTVEYFSRIDQQGTRIKRTHPIRLKRILNCPSFNFLSSKDGQLSCS